MKEKDKRYWRLVYTLPGQIHLIRLIREFLATLWSKWGVIMWGNYKTLPGMGPRTWLLMFRQFLISAVGVPGLVKMEQGLIEVATQLNAEYSLTLT